MSLMDRWTKKRNGMNEQEALDKMAAGGLMDQELSEALVNFRLSVHAWSDAELTRPRTIAHGKCGAGAGGWRRVLRWGARWLRAV